jgi:hypothetical protein
VPAYLMRFRKTGQFDIQANAESVSEIPTRSRRSHGARSSSRAAGSAPVGQKAFR